MKSGSVKDSSAKLMLALAMVIFGTIGIFRKYIPLPSGMLAMARGIIGMLFLFAVILIKREKISFENIKKNALLLCVSGVLIGANWILLFESYRYTSVAVATLCYYMAPVFVIIASSFLLCERLTKTKLICVIAAFVGMIMISGIFGEGIKSIRELLGILLGLAAAVLYAAVIILNKKLGEMKAFDKTLIQLGIAGIALLPYTLLAENVSATDFTPIAVIMLIIVGIVHTGIAYTLYFSSIGRLKAQTAAIFSYIDPAVAVVLSVLLLDEQIEAMGYIGAVLILGAAIFSERGE